MNLGIRFDVKDVQHKRSKISTKELDAQLDWHRDHRGRKIPKAGSKAIKMVRWAKAVQDYITDVEERLATIPILEGHAVGEPSESAMSIDGSSVGGSTVGDRMDID